MRVEMRGAFEGPVIIASNAFNPILFSHSIYKVDCLSVCLSACAHQWVLDFDITDSYLTASLLASVVVH